MTSSTRHRQSIPFHSLLLLPSMLGTLAVGNVTLGDLESLAHIAPVAHVE